MLSIYWIDQKIHSTALAEFLSAGRRQLSFVDCTSFEVIRRTKTEDVFCFDAHFEEQGFHILKAQL
jgi:predicted nucleic acid-binding protein